MMRWLDWLPFGHVAEIDDAELDRRLSQGDRLQLVDVRTAAEFARSHIASAIHVPIQRLPAEIDRLDRDLPVVAICKTAHGSIPAVRLLRRTGFDACQLAGGMDAWRRAGHPVQRSAA